MDVFEQFGVSVYKSVRGRGAFICDTDKGIKLFRETNEECSKYAKEDYITKAVVANGYEQVDIFERTVDGKLIAEDDDKKRYYMKQWFEAGECDTKSYSDILGACNAIGRLHNVLDKVEVPNAGEENIVINANEGCDNTTSIQAECEINQETVNSESSNGKEPDVNNESDTDKITFTIPAANSLNEKFQKKIKEMKSISNYLRKKKKKSDFERCAFENLTSYIKEGERAIELINSSGYLSEYERVIDNKILSHGSCNHHNILNCRDYVAIVNFERTNINLPITDLYDFMRKILEKYNWDIKLGYKMLDEYDKARRISNVEIETIAILFSFPEKYFKIMNHYYNSSKAWIPDKDIEKLNVVIKQNEARLRFVESLK